MCLFDSLWKLFILLFPVLKKKKKSLLGPTMGKTLHRVGKLCFKDERAWKAKGELIRQHRKHTGFLAEVCLRFQVSELQLKAAVPCQRTPGGIC